jgi:3-oxoacyl-(acyl-carrier-protein) synthase
MADAGLDMNRIDLDRAGVIMGSGIGGLQTIEDHFRKVSAQRTNFFARLFELIAERSYHFRADVIYGCFERLF